MIMVENPDSKIPEKSRSKFDLNWRSRKTAEVGKWAQKAN